MYDVTMIICVLENWEKEGPKLHF